MWKNIKYNYKIILATIAIFLLAIVLAYLFEDYFRRLVRFSFKFFNGDHIQFTGKNFHFFASNIFVESFGLFAASTFLLVKFSDRNSRLKKIFLTVIIFFVTVILVTAEDSFGLVVECTACSDGTKRLSYNELTYDKYFITSLMVAFAYLLVAYFLERKRIFL